MHVRGSVAFVGQSPWIQNMSLKDNVTFISDAPVDEERYARTVEACGLTDDIAGMAQGDATMIGDSGITLSGGQKQRLSLARATYFDADVYALDDVLSAVDAPMASHLYKKCIVGTCGGGQTPRVARRFTHDTPRVVRRFTHGARTWYAGMLKHKTRVLVTHRLGFLAEPEVTRIVIIDQGRIKHSGTYQELVAAGVDFKAMIQHGDASSMDGDDDIGSGNTRDDDRQGTGTGGNGSATNTAGAVANAGAGAGAGAGATPRAPPTIRLYPQSSADSSVSQGSESQVRHRRPRLADGDVKQPEPRTDDDGAVTGADGEEAYAHGGINTDHVWTYFKSYGGVHIVGSVVLLYILTQLFGVGTKWWLSRWSADAGPHPHHTVGYA